MFAVFAKQMTFCVIHIAHTDLSFVFSINEGETLAVFMLTTYYPSAQVRPDG